VSDYLTITDHNRVFNDCKYVYPVLSRRAGGVSLGINLNVNNACNWRCIYCQVPELKRGGPPDIELEVLNNELRASLTDIMHGQFLEQHVDQAHRTLKDIAFSGNGEPTSTKQFYQVMQLVHHALSDFNLLGVIKVRLITNGSLIDKPYVLEALQLLAKMNGEVWFKLDAGTSKEIKRINDINIDVDQHVLRLKKCAQICPTFIQTCLFTLEGNPPSTEQLNQYFCQIYKVKSYIKGVLLYGVARPSYQPEATKITRLPLAFLEEVANTLKQQDIAVSISE
jgi:wyosine [tRNA(Phe)-imidazoG37] synthetase (radical SAM superfamily)